MKQAALTNLLLLKSSVKLNYLTELFIFFVGLLAPLGFAPFHLPGVTILSITILYSILLNSSKTNAFSLGFLFGLGYFGLGVSWVIVSIHDYGNLNYVLSGLATLLFIVYLSLFPALVTYSFKLLQSKQSALANVFLFGSLWCLGEYLRATLFTGFPWLLIGTSQIDTPLRYLFPILGLYGLSFFCSFASALLATAMYERPYKRSLYIILFVLILLIPNSLKPISWTHIKSEPVSIGVVQANLAMRDKWDEALFWNLLKYYQQSIQKLLGKQLIILPESAIPLPASYLNDYLLKLHDKSLAAKSSLILGILQPTDDSETHFYNSIISLGEATGTHVKRQLVPFGEYIPQPLVALNHWLSLPEPNISPGKPNQPLMEIANHPIASLICYEIAYPSLLRAQMPQGEWIVSISDNGWFGRSLASYQQLQMAQVLSLLTGRYQIVANNDGLSSVINDQGDIVVGLPSFSAGILKSEVFPAQGATPWVRLGDRPSLIFCAFFVFLMLFLRLRHFQRQ